MKKIYLVLIALGISLYTTPTALADHHAPKNCECSVKQDCKGENCTKDAKSSCSSCNTKMNKNSRKWHPRKMDHTQFYLGHAKEIGLNKEQIETLGKHHVAYEKKKTELNAEWKTLHENFAKSVHEKNVTEAKIKQHAKAVGDLKAKKVEHRLMHQHTTAKVLTDNQNKKVWELLSTKHKNKDKKKKKRGKKKKYKKK